MRLLAVHADSLSCDPVHSTGDVEPEKYPDPVTANECIGAFVGSERGDGGRVEAVSAAAAAELHAACDQLNTDRIVLVPTPHLVDDPAESGVVEAIVAAIRGALDDLDVRSVPVGWHLDCELRTNGHPYAVRSRRLTGADRPTALARETEWFLVDPPDCDDPVSGDWSGTDLLVPIEEAAGIPAALEAVVAGERPTARTGDRLTERGLTSKDGIATNDGLRWTSAGLTMRACLRGLLAERFTAATPIRTPALYDPAADAIREHVAASGWTVEGTTVARRTLCPGHLSAFAGADLDADQLPVTLWEVGECERPDSPGPRRATLAEAHTATADLDAALEAVAERLALIADLDSTLGLDRTPVVRVTDTFYAEHGDWIGRILRGFEGPVAVERGAVSTPFAVEFVAPLDDDVVDLGWVRLDVDGPKRFGAEYADGERQATTVVVHTAPVGTLESVLATILDGDVPPWLAPTQVRLVPIDDRHSRRCLAVAETLSGASVRVDVDDREWTVGKRITAAADDRVPYYAVVGETESTGKLRVTDSESGQTEETTPAALADRIHASTPLDRRVSRRGPVRLSDRLVVGRSE